MRVVVVFAVALLLASALSTALSAGGSVKKLTLVAEAEEFARLSLPEYIALLHETHSHAVAEAEMAYIEKHLAYYERIHDQVQHTIRNVEKGGALDCVPYMLQPGLIDADRATLQVAKARWSAIREEMLSEDRQKKVRAQSGEMCPGETVGVARPVIRFAGESFPSIVVPRAKRLPNSMVQRAQEAQTHSLKDRQMPLVAGYSYVDSAFAAVDNTTNFTYSVFGVGWEVGAEMPSSPMYDFNDHSINQGWWVDETLGFGNLISLEAGWISCAYFTYFPATTLFAFSTPDGYQGSPGDQYNTQGGFIQYPGAPPVANAVTHVRYLIQYQRLPNNEGFELVFRSFRISETGIYYVFEPDMIPVGYYVMSRYPRLPQLMTYQCGQEIFMDSNSTQLTAAGKIFGWGTNTARFPILNNFTNFGVPIQYNYGNFPLFKEGTTEVGENYIHFHGVPNTTVAPGSGSGF